MRYAWLQYFSLNRSVPGVFFTFSFGHRQIRHLLRNLKNLLADGAKPAATLDLLGVKLGVRVAQVLAAGLAMFLEV
jgi:hypothetical protein